MSNPLAIAAVTITLRELIGKALKEEEDNIPDDVKLTADILVTTLPLDKARDDNATKNRVNLFLYHTMLNGTWRNMDLPPQGKPGDVSHPPLALNLYYLITAYGENNKEVAGQILLGRAMRVLHDHALLMPVEISTALAASELHDQVERVRITPQPLLLEEMYKLWTIFQTQYRISAAYEVSVVLIESTQRKRAPLPVRAANIYVSTFRRPVLEAVSPQVLLPGGKLTIQGQNLSGDTVRVRFGTTPVDPDTASDQQLEVTLPAGLRAGVNTVQVVQELKLGTPPTPHPGAGFESNVAAFVLVPRITTAPPISVAQGETLSLSVMPPVGRTQRVVLLIGDQAIALPARAVTDPETTANLSFTVPKDFKTGEFLLRVQVDGAESPLEVDTNPASPTFNQYIGPRVTIT
jgi:uncharacterized protein DUF4255/IPT/TIG domain-containing protein